MKNKIRDSISTLIRISEKKDIGILPDEDIVWLIENSKLLSSQMNALLGIANLSTGYTAAEIEDCVSDISSYDGTLH
jgi:hypothetical protein